MMDEIVTEAETPARANERMPNPHLLSYDFFKHMTTLSVLTLGGMLTLSGSIYSEAASEKMLIAMVLITGAGVAAFGGLIEMVEWANRGRGRPRILARWGRGLVAMLYGAGMGAFLSIVHGSVT